MSSSGELRKKTLSGLAWLSVGTTGQFVIRMVAMIVLARFLSPSDFGAVSASTVILGLSSLIAQLGVGPALVQKSHIDEKHLRSAFALSSLIGIACYWIMIRFAPDFASLLGVAELRHILPVIGLVFVLDAFGTVSQALLQRHLRFQALAVVETISYSVGYVVVGIGLAVLGYGVWSLVMAQIVQSFIKLLLSYWLQRHPVVPVVDSSSLRELLLFGGGFTLSTVLNYLALQGEKVVISRTLGAGALGIYDRAYQFISMPANVLGGTADRVLFPVMSSTRNEIERVGNMYLQGIGFLATVVLPISSILVVTAPEIVEVLLGAGWSDVITPLRVLAVGMIFRTSYKLSGSLARAMGAVYQTAWRQAVYAGCVILGALVGQTWGITGVAVGVLLALIAKYFIMAHLSVRLARLSWQAFLSAHVPGLVLSGIVGIGLWPIVLVLRGILDSALMVLIMTAPLLLLALLLFLRSNLVRILGASQLQNLQWVLDSVPWVKRIVGQVSTEVK